MKKWICDLQDGERVWIRVLLNEVTRGMTNKGAPYLNFAIQDKTGMIDAKYWNVDPDQLERFKNGMILDIKADVIKYKDQLQMRVLEATPCTEEIDIRDYLRSSSFSKAQLKERIQQKLHDIQNQDIRQVCLAILKEYEKDFFDYPAASKNHHDFVGGLATHVLGMMELSERVCELYPILNKDLLMAGVFLHDIGKLMELSGPVATEYTMEGKLLGHISIMQAKVSQVAEQLAIEAETAILLRHMVLSHHGVYEFGSPVLPMIPEAEALYLIDNLDARMNTLEKALDRIDGGEFTSRIFALENRSFYKAKNN